MQNLKEWYGVLHLEEPGAAVELYAEVHPNVPGVIIKFCFLRAIPAAVVWCTSSHSVLRAACWARGQVA
jgi:hypothetical protein